MRFCAIVSLLLVATTLAAQKPSPDAIQKPVQLVTDDAIRLEILRAAFPNAMVAVSHHPALDWKPNPWPGHPLKDALEGEKEFGVVGPADRYEKTYATDLIGAGPNPTDGSRRLRIKVYKLDLNGSGNYIALAHYTFNEVKIHPFCCEWFTRVFLLTRKQGGFDVDQTTWSLTERAKTVSSFAVVDVDGDGRAEVLVEAEQSGAGRRWINMSIFKIIGGRLARVAEIDTLSTSDGIHTDFERVMMVGKSRQTNGAGLYFQTTTYRDGTRLLQPPKIEEGFVKVER